MSPGCKELEETLAEERRFRREKLRRAVFDWIRDDLGITAKMGIYPSEIELLLDRLEGVDKNG